MHKKKSCVLIVLNLVFLLLIINNVYAQQDMFGEAWEMMGNAFNPPLRSLLGDAFDFAGENLWVFVIIYVAALSIFIHMLFKKVGFMAEAPGLRWLSFLLAVGFIIYSTRAAVGAFGAFGLLPAGLVPVIILFFLVRLGRGAAGGAGAGIRGPGLGIADGLGKVGRWLKGAAGYLGHVAKDKLRERRENRKDLQLTRQEYGDVEKDESQTREKGKRLKRNLDLINGDEKPNPKLGLLGELRWIATVLLDKVFPAQIDEYGKLKAESEKELKLEKTELRYDRKDYMLGIKAAKLDKKAWFKVPVGNRKKIEDAYEKVEDEVRGSKDEYKDLEKLGMYTKESIRLIDEMKIKVEEQKELLEKQLEILKAGEGEEKARELAANAKSAHKSAEEEYSIQQKLMRIMYARYMEEGKEVKKVEEEAEKEAEEAEEAEEGKGKGGPGAPPPSEHQPTPSPEAFISKP